MTHTDFTEMTFTNLQYHIDYRVLSFVLLCSFIHMNK